MTTDSQSPLLPKELKDQVMLSSEIYHYMKKINHELEGHYRSLEVFIFQREFAKFSLEVR